MKRMTITEVDIVNADVTVYAVWGLDTNGNGDPDVLETKYDVIYDVNGGNALSGPATARVLPQNDYTLSLTGPTHADTAGGDKVVFIGWTDTKDETIYEKDDTAPAMITEVDIVNADVTVYAVWGLDTNGNGDPDVLETKYDVIYDVNGGNADGPATANVLPQDDYTLSLTRPTHADTAGGDKVVFIGWTETPDTKIYSKDDTAGPVTVTKIDIDGNETVYAVWAYDENGNGDPDFGEEKYDITVHYVDRDGQPIGTPTTEIYTVLSGAWTLPSAEIPSIPNYVFRSWKVGSGPLTVNTTVTLGNVTADMDVYLVYGKDNSPGAGDGIEDFRVVRNWTKADGTALDVSLPSVSGSWNVGDYFTKGPAEDVTIPAGWTYQGYKVNGGALVAAPATPNEAVTVEKGDFTVTYVYARTTYNITVHYAGRDAVSLQASALTQAGLDFPRCRTPGRAHLSPTMVMPSPP